MDTNIKSINNDGTKAFKFIPETEGLNIIDVTVEKVITLSQEEFKNLANEYANSLKTKQQEDLNTIQVKINNTQNSINDLNTKIANNSTLLTQACQSANLTEANRLDTIIKDFESQLQTLQNDLNTYQQEFSKLSNTSAQ